MEFKTVTCYGTGLIGSAWGVNFLIKGLTVKLYDLDDQKLADAKEKIQSMLNFFKDEGVLTQTQVEDCLSRCTFTTDVKEAVTGTDFIQESGPENVAIKQSIIKAIEEYCDDNVIIGTSTSGLLVSDIAKFAKHPERIVGGHPYNPVHLIPLVELVKGEKTTDEVLQKTVAFYKEIGKEPVVLNKECPGFICNRIQMALNREAFDLVYRGVCSVEDVDKAVVFGPGLRWGLLGPHMLNELGGGKGGLRFMFEHIGPTTQVWLEDMAKWTVTPEGYVDTAEKGLHEEMANRAPGTGRTHEELEQFRDKGLVDLLKFHKKL